MQNSVRNIAATICLLTCLVSVGLSGTQANESCSSRNNKADAQPSPNARQQARSSPRTVMDYYLMLPDKYVPFAKNENRRSLVKIKDIKNGYLKLEVDGWDGWAEIALFKKTDGSSIVAVQEMASSRRRSKAVGR